MTAGRSRRRSQARCGLRAPAQYRLGNSQAKVSARRAELLVSGRTEGLGCWEGRYSRLTMFPGTRHGVRVRPRGQSLACGRGWSHSWGGA